MSTISPHEIMIEPGSTTLWDRLGALAGDIKLSHTIFAMPFALLGAFLAAGSKDRLPDVASVGLIVLCMVLARTVAMTVNRWADASLDAVNPRTAGRAIPQGRLTPTFVLSSAIASGLGFIVATGGFWVVRDNLWPMAMSPVVLAWLVAYPYTKRFTWLCHLFLGSALAISPLAAGLAVEPAWLGRLEPYLLAGMVMCWVAGFDILYALQDVQVDRATSIFSVPARLGTGPALWISRLLHAGAIWALLALQANAPVLGATFYAACLFVIVLLIVEHGLVWRTGTKHIRLAFFTLNGAVSLLLGGLGIMDIVIAVW